MSRGLTNKKAAIIISNYNGLTDTKKCLDSLVKSSFKDFFVVVVDDYSGDKDVICDFVEQYDSLDIVCFVIDRNKGFAGANNLGIKKALEYKPEYIILLNNDTVVYEDTIGQLLNLSGEDRIIGPKILKMDDPTLIYSAGGQFDKELYYPKNIGYNEKDSDEFSKIKECDYLSFCCVSMPAKVFSEVGFLDEDFYMYCEDVDYCQRLKAKGYKVVYEPMVKLLHKDGGSSSSLGDKALYYSVRNECIIRERYVEGGDDINNKLYNEYRKSNFRQKFKLNKDYNAIKAYEAYRDFYRKDVYICTTTYHFLITAIKACLNMNKPKLILSSKGLFDQKIVARIKASNLFASVNVYDNLDDFNAKLDYSASFFAKHKDMQRQLDSVVKWKHNCNYEYFLYNDVSIMGKWLNSHGIKYNLIEDGLDCYKQKAFLGLNYNDSKIRRFINQTFNVGFYCFGQSKYTKEIEVNSIEGILLNTKAPVYELPRKELFARLTKSDIEKILGIYLDKDEYNEVKDTLESINGEAASLLLTQPLFEDGITSRETEIKFYKDIIEKYAEGKLVIKPHPRDTVDYTKVFDDVIVINNPRLPAELLGYISDSCFKKVITWCSTAINNISYAEEKVFLGMDYIKPYIDGETGFESMWPGLKFI